MLLSKNVIAPGKYLKHLQKPCVLRKTVITRKYTFYFEKKTQTVCYSQQTYVHCCSLERLRFK